MQVREKHWELPDFEGGSDLHKVRVRNSAEPSGMVLAGRWIACLSYPAAPELQRRLEEDTQKGIAGGCVGKPAPHVGIGLLRALAEWML